MFLDKTDSGKIQIEIQTVGNVYVLKLGVE